MREHEFLGGFHTDLMQAWAINQPVELSPARFCFDTHTPLPNRAHLLLEALPMSFSSLEKAIKAYHQHMPATAGQPLVLSSLPVGETRGDLFSCVFGPCYWFWYLNATRCLTGLLVLVPEDTSMFDGASGLGT